MCLGAVSSIWLIKLVVTYQCVEAIPHNLAMVITSVAVKLHAYVQHQWRLRSNYARFLILIIH